MAAVGVLSVSLINGTMHFGIIKVLTSRKAPFSGVVQ